MASRLGGCSIKETVVNYAGDAIGGGGGVWSSDEDPQLVKEALPFALKTNESLLQVSPDHESLQEATATGFLAYALLYPGSTPVTAEGARVPLEKAVTP